MDPQLMPPPRSRTQEQQAEVPEPWQYVRKCQHKQTDLAWERTDKTDRTRRQASNGLARFTLKVRNRFLAVYLAIDSSSKPSLSDVADDNLLPR
eukprot:750950-Hanusia_phi.AAC.3